MKNLFLNGCQLATLSLMMVLTFPFVNLTQVGQAFAAGPTLNFDYDFKTHDNSMWQEEWAVDNFKSNITFNQTADNSDCYDYVRDDGGTFVTIGGTKTPGGDGTLNLEAGITGSIKGKLEGRICGTIRNENEISNDSPEDLTVETYANYAEKYFHHFFSQIESFSITDWGWTFSSCGNGTWTDNEQTEASWLTDKNAMGNISGEVQNCQTDPEVSPSPVASTAPSPTEPPGYTCAVAQSCSNACGQVAKDVPNGSCGFNHCDPTPACGSTGEVLGVTTGKLGGTTGQVLGASSYANTGVTADIFFSLLGFTGAGLSATGILISRNAKGKK